MENRPAGRSTATSHTEIYLPEPSRSTPDRDRIALAPPCLEPGLMNHNQIVLAPPCADPGIDLNHNQIVLAG